MGVVLGLVFSSKYMGFVLYQSPDVFRGGARAWNVFAYGDFFCLLESNLVAIELS